MGKSYSRKIISRYMNMISSFVGHSNKIPKYRRTVYIFYRGEIRDAVAIDTLQENSEQETGR